MTTHAAVLLAALWSVTFGYEPSSDADEGYDYIVQVEPELLEAMERGDTSAIEANLPAEVTPVRRIRIVVGNDELPRKLRQPVARATPRVANRPDIDGGAVAPLFAQTGPAGGYGRSATGFNNAPAGGAVTPSITANTSTTAAPATTVPAPQYRPFSYSTPTPTTNTPPSTGVGVPAVGDRLEQARDVLRETTNNIGQAGQQVIDNTRRTVSDVIAPPDNSGFNPQANPLNNVADRLQNEVRNTSDAVRDSWERANNNLANNTPPAVGAPPAGNANAQVRPFDTWGNPTNSAAGVPATNTTSAPNYRNDRYAQEQSVLAGNQGNQPGNTQQQAPLLEPPSTNNAHPNNTQPANSSQPSRNVVELDAWAQRANGQQPGATNNGNVAVDLNRGFQSASQGNNVYPGSGDSWRNNSTPVNTTSTNSQWPVVTAAPPAANTGSLSVPPAATSPTGVPEDSAQTAINNFGNAGNAQTGQNLGQQPAQQTAHPGLYVLAWAIAIGSVGANLFQWGSIVDLRNKYRVALRRNSPGFGRSMAA